MKASVVIPAHNEAASLPACLEALAAQKTKHELEVIVVNNASADQTAKVAKSWADRLNLSVINEPQLGRGSARRRGFAKAKTDIILSTDADTIVPPDWVESLTGILLKHPEAVAVGGPSYIADGTRLTNWTARVGMPLSFYFYRLMTGHYMFAGANFAIRRKAYEAASGFDPKQDMLDDLDLAFRVSKVGPILFVKKPRVLTKGDIFRHGYLQGAWHYGRHFPSLFKRYGLRGGKLPSNKSRIA